MMLHYVGLVTAYLGLSIIWYRLTWVTFEGTLADKSLQAALMALPVMKLFQVANYTQFTAECPWQN